MQSQTLPETGRRSGTCRESPPGINREKDLERVDYEGEDDVDVEDSCFFLSLFILL